MRGRLLIACLILAFLAGCSSTRFFYNRLDFLLPWYLGDYVELDRQQDRYLHREVDAFLAWHRREELPRYLTLLDDFVTRLDREVTTEDLVLVTVGVERALLRLQERALESMLALGDELADRQITEFIATLREQQSEYEEKYLERSDSEYRDDACERLIDNARTYIGRLQSEQKDALHQACDDLQRSDSVWLEARAGWLVYLEQILQREPGWQERLRRALAARNERMSEQYRAVYNHNFGVIQQAVVTLLNSRSERQDAHLRRKLDKLRRDISALIEQGLDSSQWNSVDQAPLALPAS
ncbi:hypothetical protein CWI75_03210 [Kineobactrum sediminis]|uniref:Lipoprotein n=1 Tax=Kineobactrum sediminis TaxID=1905677 RepID=A0A2N5Y7J6_9GAMM|nr:DUF6279 family lipoprotein [Kineobactrum sediminis]PLW84362.1 hypothetical protein CWI75_03210 [Kineobactrum sediminis]